MSTRIPATDSEWTLKEFCNIPYQAGMRYNTYEKVEACINGIVEDFDGTAEADEIRCLLLDAVGAIEEEMTEGKEEGEEFTKEEKERFDEKIEDIRSSIDESLYSSKHPEEDTILFMEDVIGEARASRFRKMDPEERRKYCADRMAENSKDRGSKTGKFFAALAGGGKGKKRPWEAGRELGERIMEKYNVNYPKRKKN
jgi:hypothetical protein